MHVLAVDDDKMPLRILERNVLECGYTVSIAHSGREAWEKLESVQIDMVVTDWLMPEMNGLELCRQIRNTDFKRYIYVIMVTGRDGKEEIIRGLEAGADDYLTKPVNPQELQARMRIGARIVELERKLNDKYNVIKDNFYQTIQMFSNLIELFNADLGGHCKRVAKLSLRLAERIPEISLDDLPVLETTGLLHDVGMVGLPVELMSKGRTELNAEEKQFYLSHPVHGETILQEIEFLQPVAKLVRAHHEQFNGRGFPDGLKDDEIPLLAKIVSCASVYDNLINRGKFSLEEIPSHLHRLRGYQLDPVIADHLLEINHENILDEKGKKYLEVKLIDLKEGMLLAENIRRANGALVMPREMKLTGSSIEKLIDFCKMGCISDKAQVYK